MSEETKNETSSSTETNAIIEKAGFFKRTWKTIVTGVVCAVVGGGVMAGADAAKIQESITKAQARNIAIQAAAYSAEQAIAKVTVIATTEKKAEAIKEAIDATTAAIPAMIEAATTVKEAAEEAKSNAEEAKKAIEEDKAATDAKIKNEDKK